MSSCPTSYQIWEQHKDKLEAFICGKVNGDDNCHDILHDLFLKIKEKEERIKLLVQPASYVIKMAQNCGGLKILFIRKLDYYETSGSTTAVQTV